jgi:hypothetical protein
MATVNVPVVPGVILEKNAATDSIVASEPTAQERSLLRWGGLSGLLGAVIFLLSIIFQVAFVGTGTTAAGAGPVIRFPAKETAIIIGQTLFLVGTVLVVPLYLTLYRALRSSSLAPALFGGAVSFLGLAVLAVESEPNVAMAQISAQYHAAGATATQQATAVQLWQATQGMFNEYDTCAYVFLSIGFIILGIALARAPKFGRLIGGMSAAFGVAGLVALASFPVDSGSFAPFALLTFAVFPLVLGWKLFGLSGARQDPIPPAATSA